MDKPASSAELTNAVRVLLRGFRSFVDEEMVEAFSAAISDLGLTQEELKTVRNAIVRNGPAVPELAPEFRSLVMSIVRKKKSIARADCVSCLGTGFEMIPDPHAPGYFVAIPCRECRKATHEAA